MRPTEFFILSAIVLAVSGWFLVKAPPPPAPPKPVCPVPVACPVCADPHVVEIRCDREGNWCQTTTRYP